MANQLGSGRDRRRRVSCLPLANSREDGCTYVVYTGMHIRIYGRHQMVFERQQETCFRQIPTKNWVRYGCECPCLRYTSNLINLMCYNVMVCFRQDK